MNKKIIVLILTVFCILATIIISVFGKVPEDTSRVPVSTIMFVDNTTEDGMCEVNEEGIKIILIEKGTTEYQLQYFINPSEATDQSVSFQIVSGIEYASVSETGVITFYEQSSVTVKIYSNALDFKSDVVIIDFEGGNSTVIPDDDSPF
jgi:hypothetical protein